MNRDELRKHRAKNASTLFLYFSSKTIAETIGKSPAFVSKIKNGESPLPLECIEPLHARLAIYGITEDYLMTLTKAEKDNI